MFNAPHRDSFSFGGESAVFSKEELNAVRSVGFSEASIQLVGFKPLRYLRWNMCA